MIWVKNCAEGGEGREGRGRTKGLTAERSDSANKGQL